MKCKVYKSLDRPTSFFGVRGRFVGWLALLVCACLVVSLVVGSFFGSVAGVILFLLCGASAYLFVIGLQDKWSDKDFSLKLNSVRYCRYVRRSPGPVCRYWMSFNG